MNCKVIALFATFCALIFADTAEGGELKRKMARARCFVRCTYRCITVTGGSRQACSSGCRATCGRQKRNAVRRNPPTKEMAT